MRQAILFTILLIAGSANAAGVVGIPKVWNVTAPDIVTLQGVHLSWSEAINSSRYAVYAKGPSDSAYSYLDETTDLNLSIPNYVRGDWRYVVRGCNAGSCGPFSDAKVVTFQGCHDANTATDDVQSFSIITNTTQCVNLTVTANKRVDVVYSSVTDREPYFYVGKGHNSTDSTKYLNSTYTESTPDSLTFTPKQSKVYLKMITDDGDSDITQLMVIYDEPTHVLSVMFMDYEGNDAP